MTPAEYIKKIRFSYGLNKREFAHKLAIVPSLITIYESGNREPGFPIARKLVQAAKENGIHIEITDLKTK